MMTEQPYFTQIFLSMGIVAVVYRGKEFTSPDTIGKEVKERFMHWREVTEES